MLKSQPSHRRCSMTTRKSQPFTTQHAVINHEEKYNTYQYQYIGFIWMKKSQQENTSTQNPMTFMTRDDTRCVYISRYLKICYPSFAHHNQGTVTSTASMAFWISAWTGIEMVKWWGWGGTMIHHHHHHHHHNHHHHLLLLNSWIIIIFIMKNHQSSWIIMNNHESWSSSAAANLCRTSEQTVRHEPPWSQIVKPVLHFVSKLINHKKKHTGLKIILCIKRWPALIASVILIGEICGTCGRTKVLDPSDIFPVKHREGNQTAASSSSGDKAFLSPRGNVQWMKTGGTHVKKTDHSFYNFSTRKLDGKDSISWHSKKGRFWWVFPRKMN